MKEDNASIRPLVQMEVERPHLSMCSCGKAKPLYVIRWVETVYNSRAYRRGGGKSSYNTARVGWLCRQCAEKWAKENDLVVHDAPIPDPAPGQKWRHVYDPPVIVTVTACTESKYGPMIDFIPSLRLYTGQDIHSIPPHRFLDMFYPMLGGDKK